MSIYSLSHTHKLCVRDQMISACLLCTVISPDIKPHIMNKHQLQSAERSLHGPCGTFWKESVGLTVPHTAGGDFAHDNKHERVVVGADMIRGLTICFPEKTTDTVSTTCAATERNDFHKISYTVSIVKKNPTTTTKKECMQGKGFSLPRQSN